MAWYTNNGNMRVLLLMATKIIFVLLRIAVVVLIITILATVITVMITLLQHQLRCPQDIASAPARRREGLEPATFFDAWPDIGLTAMFTALPQDRCGGGKQKKDRLHGEAGLAECSGDVCGHRQRVHHVVHLPGGGQ